jgi:hypothetical protein
MSVLLRAPVARHLGEHDLDAFFHEKISQSGSSGAGCGPR